MSNNFTPVYPHGKIEEVFNDIYFITGSIKLPIPLPMVASRNMVVVADGKSLTLINSVRLDDEGLADLERLGSIDHVIRIAAFHGADDMFYKERYGAKVWSVKGQLYARGFNASATEEDAYFTPDEWIDETSKLPLKGARLVVIKSSHPPEGLVYIEREGGIIVPGDVLQNWDKPDRYFNFIAAVMMRLMGFIKAFNVGPGWLKSTKPDNAEIKKLLELDFEHVLPAHGAAVLGGAKEKYRPAIETLK